MEISLNHSLIYTTKGDVPISVVAKTLVANERLLQESLRILSDCYDGLQVQKVTVRVRSLSNTSPLREAFAIGLFIAFQDELEREVPELIEKLTGYTIPESYDTLVTVLVLIVAIYVIEKAISRYFPGKDAKELKAEYETKLGQLEEMTGLGREQLRRVVDERFGNGRAKSLFAKARDLFLPAKIERDVEILMDDRPGVSAPAILEIPDNMDFEMESGRNVYDVYGVDIEIHRADIDYSNRGWVAVISDISDKRKKMVLPPDIQPDELYGKTRIRGDVTVVEEKQIDGELAVREYHLLRMY